MREAHVTPGATENNNGPATDGHQTEFNVFLFCFKGPIGNNPSARPARDSLTFSTLRSIGNRFPARKKKRQVRWNRISTADGSCRFSASLVSPPTRCECLYFSQFCRGFAKHLHTSRKKSRKNIRQGAFLCVYFQGKDQVLTQQLRPPPPRFLCFMTMRGQTLAPKSFCALRFYCRGGPLRVG